MKNIAVFVSGSGTNMERIATYFASNENVNIVLVLCNNPQAGAIERTKRLHIPLQLIDKSYFKSEKIVEDLKKHQIDFIVLAGFLWLVPSLLIKNFPIINIHPALLPNYGGKGMYGSKVHEAVVQAKEPYSGITIHYVNEHYDEGTIIFQKKIKLDLDETPGSLARKIHELEYAYFPKVIEKILSEN
jgi:phosphoribosylglycinamide formyltransferase-1